MGKDIDEAAEFDMILAELVEMGMVEAGTMQKLRHAFSYGVIYVLIGVASGLSLKSSADSKKEVLLEELREAELLKELEDLVLNLDDDQFDVLEAIMGKDIDEAAEFDMILAELVEMGMVEEDVHDLKQLAALMYKFLIQVPEISSKLSKEYDLLDNIQLYLLGLPNKLGPLGYIALHNVLEDEDEEQKEEIVDIKIESLSVADDTSETAPKFRKRR